MTTTMLYLTALRAWRESINHWLDIPCENWAAREEARNKIDAAYAWYRAIAETFEAEFCNVTDSEVQPVKAKTKLEQLQAAYDDAKQHCNHFPQDGRIEFLRGGGYFVSSPCYQGKTKTYRQLNYCWLGNFQRGMRFFADAKATGIPNFSNLRVGVK